MVGSNFQTQNIGYGPYGKRDDQFFLVFKQKTKN